MSFHVMFIFYFPEDFFHQIFQRHNARCSAELIHHHSNAFLVTEQLFHQFVGSHCFGDNGNRTYMGCPVIRMFKQLGRVDIANYIINILLVNQYLRQTCLNETGTKLVQRDRLVASNHFRTRHATVAQTDIGKIQRILKYLHFRIHLRVIRRIFNALLDEIVQIDFSQAISG